MLIITHCSAMPQGVSLGLENRRHDHIFHRNFRDTGCHFCLIRDGEIYHERPLDKIGTHCQGHNRHLTSICYEGELDNSHKPPDTRTLLQKASLVALLRELKQTLPNVLAVGHHDLNPMREYPCFNAVTGYGGL